MLPLREREAQEGARGEGEGKVNQAEQKEIVLGEKYGSRKLCYYIREEKRTREIFCPVIEVNGEMMYISDKATQSGLMECRNPSAARRTAKVELEKLKAKTTKEE